MEKDAPARLKPGPADDTNAAPARLTPDPADDANPLPAGQDFSPARSLVLVCNSHIDPVWLWPWEEGLAATLATFRAAADLCERVDDFVFCHNEALLYMWVEEHEPPLFARIQRLVGDRRWHIMGGWYLQPDCNLPSGESLVRQILVGKQYFLDRFGVEPRVGVNLDPFGHTRGLVQILAKSGYDGYLFCRPDARFLDLPSDDFLWVGHDGSTVVAHRAREHYNSELGKARAKVEQWLAACPDRRRGLLLWGVGNHGGGPSRQDLRAIAEAQATCATRAIAHGRPEDYLAQVQADLVELPRVESDLNPWAVGCYTSMATVKQAHVRLEHAVFAAEKMLAGAVLQGLLPYPHAALRDALEALLFCQFHDILPGECVQEVEQQAMTRLAHGLDIVSRLRARAFFALVAGEAKAAEGEYPIFVHNHHPFAVDETIVCEFQPPEPNVNPAVFWLPELRGASGAIVPLQLEKESCNIQCDQRKRIAFRARLAPSAMARFSCRLPEVEAVLKPQQAGLKPCSATERDAVAEQERTTAAEQDFSPACCPAALFHQSDRMVAEIDLATGLLTRYAVDGVDYFAADRGGFRALVMKDSADPWGMKVRAFRDVVGEFRLMSPAEAAAFAGVQGPALPPVRIIERGPVRTIVEALFAFNRSALCLRYKLPATGSEVEVEARVSWGERDRLLKLAVPTRFAGGLVRSQTAYGADDQCRLDDELVGHRWVSLVSPDGAHALTLINDGTYGFDVRDGDLRVSLLRAPAYAGHPVDDVTPITRQDRYEPREDQGDHTFRFWLNGGPADERRAAVDREATVRNDGLMAVCAFPPGPRRATVPAVVIDDAAIQLGAMKISEDGRALIVRLFEPTGQPRRTRVRVPPLDVVCEVALGAFEIRTLAIDLQSRAHTETDLLEREVRR
jgi:alpha-mannosidase